MKVKELKIGDTIDGFIIHKDVRPRPHVVGQIEVPLLIPMAFDDPHPLMYVEYNGKYYYQFHPYTFGEDDDLDLVRYVVIRDGKRLTE